MRRKEQLIDHGLIKLFLFALVMLTPFTAWAQTLTVGGIDATDADALQTAYGTTVSFNSSTNTLTLNEATIDMSETPGYCPIESSIANLTIHLIGFNKLTPNSDNYKGIRYSVGVTAGSLSFTTEDQNGFGSLQVDGIYSFDDFASGYNITNSFATGAQTGWAKVESGNASSAYKSVMIKYIEYYNVWIDSYQLNSDNLSPVSGGTVYIPSTHTLHLENYGYNDDIKSGLPELIVEVAGTSNSLRAFKFQSTDAVTSGTLTIKKDSNPYTNTCKLTLSNAEGGVITNFSSVTIEEPMKLVTPSTTPTWNDDVHSAVISNEDEQFYGIIVGATQVTDNNAEDVLGDGTVKYFPNSKTLLLKGANIVLSEGYDLNAAITISTPSNLANVKLQGTNIIDANGLYAFNCSNETELEMTFSTDETPGQLVLKNGGDGIFFGNVSPEYDNNLVLSSNADANKNLIAQGAIMSPGSSVYWPDQKYTISGSGTNIKYQDYMNHFAETAYAGEFTMETTGRYNVAITQTLTVDDTPFNQTVGGNIYSVRNKPTFSVEAGTYNASQSVKIENLPDELAASAGNYPQVWYYLGENTNDSIQYTSAAQEIAISESTKVCVYIIDEDSGKKMKSKVVESQYVIRQDPGLQYMQGENPIEVVDWTMGGTDNPALPTLKNTNEVAVTYESSDPAVATVAADGTVTPVGVGSTTITATSAQTDVYTAGTASYTLNVYKNLSHSSITIEVAEVTYNGAPLEPTVTVKDGETSIANYVSVAYSNNTNAALSTAETAPTVTITPKELASETNWYTGTASKTFTITAMSLENAQINDIDDQPFTGEAITPTLMVTEGDKILVLDTDYIVAYSDNVNAGTATATITGKGNYQGTKSKTFTITAMSLEGATVTVDATQTYTYTGSEIKPSVTVSLSLNDEPTTLTLDTDYTVSYTNNVNAATADAETNAPTVTVTGKGNYTGSQPVKFTINPKAVTAAMIADIIDQMYSGAAITPTLTVTDDGKTLALNTDYEVAYTDNVNAGTATATITGKGNYGSTASKTFTIGKATITEVTLTETSFTYNGKEQTATIASVKAGDLTLTADDYEVSGNTGTAKGTYTVTVTAKETSNFTGSKTAEFTIGVKAVTAEMIASIADQTYTGTAITPTLTVKDDETTLTLDTDYTVAYTDNINVGTATATITGKGNYGSTASKTFTISAKALTAAMIADIADQTYTGSAITPTLTVTDGDKTLTLDTDYEVSYTNNINVASASDNLAPTVTVTGKGNYKGTASTTFTISAKTVTAAMIADIADQTYSGAAITPTLTVTDDGKTLALNTDYEVAYTDNVNAGTATATITGKGNYGSTASKTFTISPKELTAAMVTLSAESFEYSGETQKPEVTVADGELMTADDYTIVNNGGKDVGTYEVTVTAKRNYTGEVTKTFEIVNRKLKAADITFSENWASYYNATENIDLPEGIAAYVLTAVSGTSATATQISYIPAGVAVLLQNNVTTTTTNTSADGNLMVHAAEAVDVTTVSGTVYGLYNGKLMRVASGTIPAGKNYLRVNQTSGAPQLTITVDNTTAIEMLENAAAIENGTDEWFTLDGRKLQQKPTKKGLYIKNGKVVVNNK